MTPRYLRRLGGAACVGLAIWAAAAAAQTTAVAQTTAPAINSTLPIEIEADTLEVDQAARLAVFAGNVEALQGQLRLSADELRVHYVGAAPGAGQAEISHIDAEGQVFFSTENETAQGDRGTYDVENGIVTLTGAVVLTRGDDVIRGRRVVLNLETGQSRVDAGDGEAGDGRVRGLFAPRQQNR